MKAQQFFAEGKRLARRSQELMDRGLFDLYEKTRQKLDVWASVKEEMQQGQPHGYKKHDRVRFLGRRGQVYRAHRDGTYDIRYDDGQIQTNIGHDLIQKIKSSRRFRLMDRVRARLYGGKRTYPGTIAHVHRDGTYSIDYDRGDFEKHVPASRISPDSISGSSSSIGSLSSESSLGMSPPRTPRSIRSQRTVPVPVPTRSSRRKSPTTTAPPATKNIKASRPRPREEQQSSCSVM